MFAQSPAVEHLADDIGAGDFPDHQLDAAIGEQNLLAWFHVTRELLIGGGNELGGSHHVSRRNGDRLPGPQRYRQTVLETAGPDLWALQVLQNADGASQFRCHLTKAVNHTSVVLVRAVGEVEPGDVHPAQHQLAHHLLSVAGRTDGADDLGPAAKRSRVVHRVAVHVSHWSEHLHALGLGTKFGMRSKEEPRIAQSVELGANQNHHRDDVQPDEQRYGSCHRAIDDIVIGEVAQIKAKHQCGGEPQYGGQRGAGQHTMPWLRAWHAMMVNETDDGNAGKRSEDPAQSRPQPEHVWPELVAEVIHNPRLNLVAEHQQNGSEDHRNASEDDQEEGNHALLHQPPDLGHLVGIAEALHPRDHHARSRPQSDGRDSNQKPQAGWFRAAEVLQDSRASSFWQNSSHSMRNLTIERGCGVRLREHRSYKKYRREQRKDGGESRAFGHGKGVVQEGPPQRQTKMFEKPKHTRRKLERKGSLHSLVRRGDWNRRPFAWQLPPNAAVCGAVIRPPVPRLRSRLRGGVAPARVRLLRTRP